MARHRTTSNETILEAARVIFTRDGPGAPTSAVAKAVGVSEATIFKRFASKELLLQAALRCPVDLWRGDTTERVGRTTIDRELREIVTELISFFREVIPRMVMLMSSGGLDPMAVWRGAPATGSDGTSHAGPRLVIARLSTWAEAEMHLGRLKPRPPEIVARTISAACHQFVFFELTGMGPAGGEALFIDEFSALLLDGIAADSSEAPST